MIAPSKIAKCVSHKHTQTTALELVEGTMHEIDLYVLYDGSSPYGLVWAGIERLPNRKDCWPFTGKDVYLQAFILLSHLQETSSMLCGQTAISVAELAWARPPP